MRNCYVLHKLRRSMAMFLALAMALSFTLVMAPTAKAAPAGGFDLVNRDTTDPDDLKYPVEIVGNNSILYRVFALAAGDVSDYQVCYTGGATAFKFYFEGVVAGESISYEVKDGEGQDVVAGTYVPEDGITNFGHGYIVTFTKGTDEIVVQLYSSALIKTVVSGGVGGDVTLSYSAYANNIRENLSDAWSAKSVDGVMYHICDVGANFEDVVGYNGDVAVFTVAPDAGYMIKSFKVDGDAKAPSADNKYTLTAENPVQYTVDVEFEPVITRTWGIGNSSTAGAFEGSVYYDGQGGGKTGAVGGVYQFDADSVISSNNATTITLKKNDTGIIPWYYNGGDSCNMIGLDVTPPKGYTHLADAKRATSSDGTTYSELERFKVHGTDDISTWPTSEIGQDFATSQNPLEVTANGFVFLYPRPNEAKYYQFEFIWADGDGAGAKTLKETIYVNMAAEGITCENGPSYTLTTSKTSLSTTQKVASNFFAAYDFAAGSGAWADDMGADNAAKNTNTAATWATLKKSASTDFTVKYEAEKDANVKFALAYKIETSDGEISTVKLLAYDDPGEGNLDLYVGKVWDVLGNKSYVSTGGPEANANHGDALADGYSGYWGRVGGKLADDADYTYGPETFYFFAQKNGTYKITVDLLDVSNGVTSAAKPLATETITVKVTNPTSSSSSGGGGTSYSITVSSGTGGSISPTSASVSSGGSKTFTIKADDGYVISDVLVDDKSVGAVSTYTFSNVKETHTIKAVFEKKDGSGDNTTGGFADVAASAWYSNAVAFVVEKNLFNGTSETSFSPSTAMTREMFVTVLGRLAKQLGIETSGHTNSFGDVASGQWYSEFIAWGAANSLVEGYNTTTFGLGDSITREQMALLIVRFAEYAKITLGTSAETVYKDASSISGWATEAVKTATAAGLFKGDNGNFYPQRTATRAEVAQVFKTLYELYVK